MKPGDKLEVDCVNYVCDGQAKSMVPVEKGTVASQLRDSIHAKIYFISNCLVDIFLILY